MPITRRFLLKSSAAALIPLRAASAPARIEKISLSTIPGNFHKFVAMNSYDDSPKGKSYTNTLVQISTDSGVEGVGVMGYAKPDAVFMQDLRSLIGVSPESLYDTREGRIAGRSPRFSKLLEEYKHLDGPLCDLIGKLRGVPCWQLFGDAVRDRVEVYDGTLYFSDLWFRERAVRAVVDEAEEAVRSGYKGMKLKLGRGSKWMHREEGLLRDIEIVRAVRSTVGRQVKILVDANNGFAGDFEGAWRLLEQTREQDVHWIEELFPEDAKLYGQLREHMRQAGVRALIADGENMRSAEEFGPYLSPERVIDVLQMDIRTGGFLDCLKMTRMGESQGAISVPHNWGSRVGLLMSLHLAKTQKSIVAAEDDRSTCPALLERGYEFSNGTYKVSDEPGLGLEVNKELYEAPEYPEQTVLR